MSADNHLIDRYSKDGGMGAYDARLAQDRARREAEERSRQATEAAWQRQLEQDRQHQRAEAERRKQIARQQRAAAKEQRTHSKQTRTSKHKGVRAVKPPQGGKGSPKILFGLLGAFVSFGLIVEFYPTTEGSVLLGATILGGVLAAAFWRRIVKLAFLSLAAVFLYYAFAGA